MRRLPGRRHGCGFSGVRRLGVALVAALLLSQIAGCRPSRLPAGTGFNVVLVTVDTVRADKLGCYGGTVTTPAMDRLAREGVRFDQAVSAVPLTLPSHATILTGLLPPHHGLRNNGVGRLPESVPTLATRLGQAGYATGAFIGAFVLDHRFGVARGFDLYDDEIDRGDARGTDALEAERPGRVVVDRALAWLDAQPRNHRPYFLWVHLYDAHAPYNPPEPFRGQYAHPYDGEIAGVDAQVGRLLEALDARGDTARTVVAVLGDHGESLGEHGEDTHGLLLYESTLRVPLLLRAPGVIPASSVIRAPVSLADIAPTLLSLVSVSAGEQALDGCSLASAVVSGAAVSPQNVYSETEYPATYGWSGIAAMREGGRKYISAPTPELYDLDRDPREARNLLDPPRALPAFENAIADVRRGAMEAGPAADGETRARLASLGYVASGTAVTKPGGDRRDPKQAAPLFRRFEQAHRDLEGGRVTEAARALEQLLVADPENPVFLAVLAQAEQRRGDLARAIALHQRAVGLRPDDTGERYELALVLQEAGRTHEARLALMESIRRDEAFPEAHNALGIALAAENHPEEALAEFQRALVLDPRGSRALNNAGNVLRELGRTQEAEQVYRRALAIDPRYADPHTGLGAVELTNGNAARALEQFDAALALAPHEYDILVNRGIALEMLGRIDDARSAYRTFLASAAAPEYASARSAARQLLARLDTLPHGRSSVSH